MRRAALTALALIAFGAASTPARAGTYDVVACGAGGVNNSWSPYVPGARMQATSGCSGGGIVASNRLGAGAPGPGEQAWQSFWAPPGAKVVAVTMTGGYWRPGASEPGAEDYSAELADPVSGVFVDGCSAYSTARCSLWYPGGRTVAVSPTDGVAFVVSCRGARCRGSISSPSPEFGAASAAVRMTALSVRVSDDTVPSVPAPAGDVTGGWVRGTRTVSVRGSDNSGVRAVRAYVDGQARGSDTLACDYTQTAPCPASSERSFAIDTTTLADGTHTLRVEAVDTAANAGSSSATIRVDNTAPSVAVSGAGSPGAAHPGPVTVSLDAHDSASGMGEIVWRLDDATEWTHVPGDEAGVAVVADGEHRLTYYAVDAAGNRSSDQTRTVTIKRTPEASPRDAGPGFADRAANPGTTFTAARRFGPPCPQAATLSADRTAVINARALLVGFPLPGAPDCTMASATLRLYVTAHDGTPIAATRASSSWSAGSVTWDTRPGLVGPSATAPAQTGWVEWDVTAQVAGLYRHGDNGLYLSGAATDRAAQLVVRFAE